MNLENIDQLANAEDNENYTEAIQNDFEIEQAFVPTTKAELLAHAVQLHHELTDFVLLFNKLKKIKPFLDDFIESEKNIALDKFVTEGGDVDGFEFKLDADTLHFEQQFKAVRESFAKQQAQLVANKESNLKTKQAILKRMRELLDSEEDNLSNTKFKTLQQEWKATGAVAPTYVQELWANYNALVNRFYNNRSIFYELKELDRKKNLEAKVELCLKAEALCEEAVIPKALKELNDIHQEYKLLGPVPQEQQETIWLRLKQATDAVYQNKRVYDEQIKAQFAANLQLKKDMLPQIQAFDMFESDSIQEWNKQSEQITALKEQWFKIGAVDKDKSSGIDKLFWTSFKSFFNRKEQFYKQLDAMRNANLQKKENLILQAEAVLLHEDIEQAINAIKRLQADWKKVGPTPKKVNEQVFLKFKTICDAIFEKKRQEQVSKEAAYSENLVAKKALCDQLESIITVDANPLLVTSMMEAWERIGFVPSSELLTLNKRFNDGLDKLIDELAIEPSEKVKLKLFAQMGLVKDTPDAKIIVAKKEQGIKRHIKELQEEGDLLLNNLAFFAKSKNADVLKKEVEAKVAVMNLEIKTLQEQLKVIAEVFQ
ncbi:MAG: hypothetical protein RL308_2346 [Bacteroidota bacterium]|jgi:hypothetical protein